MDKSVTPTNFRKSNTRWLVNLGFSQARIENRQGRQRGSEHTRRYLARFGEDSNERTYARLHGKDVGVEEPESVRRATGGIGRALPGSAVQSFAESTDEHKSPEHKEGVWN